MESQPRIVFCILACATIDRYRQLIFKINQTWGSHARALGLPVLFFLGEEPTDLKGKDYVYLSGVSNDYLSASDKQYFGLKYIADVYEPDFVYICGLDTYPLVSNLLEMLESMDPEMPACIGGNGDYRQIGNERVYFHSGGAGLILSRAALMGLYPQLNSAMSDWIKLCKQPIGKGRWPWSKPITAEGLIPACDVGISYFLQKLGVAFVDLKNRFFYDNYLSALKRGGDIKTMLACHLMSLEDFDQLTKILAK